jgi:hypothetical protein
MAEMIAWACRTPRRLVGVVLVPILLLVLIGSFWSGRLSGEGSSGAGGSVPTVSAQVPDAAPFVTAAVRFVNTWGKLAPGQTPDEWRDAVRALATTDLSTRLDQTDLNGLVNASASGKPDVRFLTTASALVAVPMTNGRPVLITVVNNDNQRWLVDDVQPDIGN